MKLTYANCFVSAGSHGDVLLTDELAVARSAPASVRVVMTDALIDADVAQATNIAVWNLAFDWFRFGVGDPTLAGGVSAGDLAGSEVAIALLMPATRAALGVTAATGDLVPDSFTSFVPEIGGLRFRATESVQADVADAVIQARFGASVPIARYGSQQPETALLCEKYARTRDPDWLTAQPSLAFVRDTGAAWAINLAAAIRGGRRGGSRLLVYEYNPTHAFAEQYGEGERMRLARCRTPRSDLAQIISRGDHLVLPPRAAQRYVPGLVRRLQSFAETQHEELARRFRLAGIDLWPVLRDRVLSTVARYGAFAAAGGPAWRAQLKRHRVEAVLVPFDGPPEARLLVRVAQSMGIPTFVLNDGFKADDFSMEGMTADHALAWSESIAEHYFRRRSRMGAEVTGNPKADRQARVGARAAWGSHVRRLLVGTFTFSPVDLNCRRSDSETFLEAVLEGVRQSRLARHAVIRIKLHPADRVAHYRRILARFPELELDLVTSGDVADEFDAADLYITTYSTSLLEAAARQLPVIYYRVNPQRLHPPFSDDPFLAKRTAESPRALGAMIDDPATFALPPLLELQAWVERYLGPTDGRSTERITRAVRSRLAASGEVLTPAHLTSGQP